MERLIDSLWRPFRSGTREGRGIGDWINDDEVEFTDLCEKVAVECDRSRLPEAIRAVKCIGRKLRQEAMWFEVDGYDGVQFLRIK